MTLIDFGMARTVKECERNYTKAGFEFDLTVLFDAPKTSSKPASMSGVLKEMYNLLKNGRFTKPLAMDKVVQEAEYFDVDLENALEGF